MARGKVKWFDPKKGFGFVVNENGVDVFVHYTNIVGEGFRCLKNGQTVVYKEKPSQKGFQGLQVQILSENDECVASDKKQELKKSPHY
jgi:CspA family cold shock protein